MKRAHLIPVLGVAIVTVPSCGDFASSLNSQSFSPNTNPLDSPGSASREELVEAGPKFEAGSWVEVTDANAGLYSRVPRGNERPQYSLKPGTPLKVVGGQGTYVKVETEGGEIGYVPSIMVGRQASDDELPIVTSDPGGPEPPIDPIDTIDPIEPIDPDPGDPGDPGETVPGFGVGSDDGFLAPEPEVPPISVEESPPAPSPIVPPDPVGEDPVPEVEAPEDE